MSILSKFTAEGSDLSQFNGETPPITNQDTPNSPLHNEYSINGTPGLPGYPTPSELDMNGTTPEKYSDNLPEY
jgi:hypothetical protein